MIDKEKRAHDYAKILLASDHSFDGGEHLAREAWELADAMQAESDKRKVVGVPEAIQDSTTSPKDWQPDWRDSLRERPL